MSDKRKSFLIGALVGAAVGSVTALLLAPKSGRELRQDIKEGAQQVGEKTQTAIKQVGETTSNLVDAAKGKVNDLRAWRQSRRHQDDDAIAQVSATEDCQVFEEEFEEVAK
ncbi:gas vesicle protein [Paenibacillus selenitireducens]|uniref:Gas vesicle protein n=1 Tax=Paenibacillus selenitireducens TaxID=1324314 RepID=A0A1T2XMP4_9BACL|nr:YtxH domain-containing protein [Paenibacillus selenitireducens]OPA81085.1 gas vesicle protein [Paenibacillus selenitireducens]